MKTKTLITALFKPSVGQKLLKYLYNTVKLNTDMLKNLQVKKQIVSKSAFNFCNKKPIQNQPKIQPLKAQQIPVQHLQIVATQQKVEDTPVEVFHAKGTLSILDKVQGVKNRQSGDLYVLMFTCGQCNHKQIRSFTKTAYHKGVVLVRCQGCQKIHLVADNLGWFQDEPVNVETLHQGKVQKVHDQQAIGMFLQKAFGDQEQLLKQDQPQVKQAQPQVKQTQPKVKQNQSEVKYSQPKVKQQKK